MAIAGVTSLVLLQACSDQQPTDVPDSINLARGGGGPDPTVESVTPPEAPQNTTLDVLVKGANFDDGSKVRFLLGGKPTKNIATNSTQFVNGDLKANITIALDAETVKYDIEVTTSKKRRGIGTELFEVKTNKGVGPDKAVTFTATVGIVSVGAQPALTAGSATRLNVYNCCGDGFFATINLMQTVTDVSPTACGSENDPTGLAAYLTTPQVLGDDEQPGVGFSFQVDRTKEISRRHGLSFGWVQPTGATDAGKNIQIKLRNDKDFGPLTVSEEDGVAAGLEADQTRFTFSGGEVAVLRGTKPAPSDKDKLICPYDGEDIVILLDRSPS